MSPKPKNKVAQPTNKKKQADEDEDEDDADEDEEEVEEVETDDDDEAETDDDDSDDEVTNKPSKKQKAKGLVPREPTIVPAEVLKAAPKEVRKLLKQREELQAQGDKKGLRKIRMALRKAGFRLSDLTKNEAQDSE
jgi:hypothetical protein